MNLVIPQGDPCGNSFVPSNSEELAVLWRAHYDAAKDQTILPVGEVLGVITHRPEASGRVLSLDLCEIVRETHVAVACYLGHDASYVGGVVWNYDGHGLDGERNHAPIVVNLINGGKVSPVREIDWIRQALQKIHKSALVVANTSCAVGTEKATIEFLNKYLPGCFDGILFPRNYDGTGTLTKGLALQYALRTVHAASAKVVHIDDAPHHNSSVVNLKKCQTISETRAIMPLFKPGDNAVNRQEVRPPEGVVPATCIQDAFSIAMDCLSTKAESKHKAVHAVGSHA